MKRPKTLAARRRQGAPKKKSKIAATSRGELASKISSLFRHCGIFLYICFLSGTEDFFVFFLHIFYLAVCAWRSSLCRHTFSKVKRDLLQCQKRPTTVSKETTYSVKRDLLQCQKRPTTVSKETYYSVKRDLLQCQKRPAAVSKETYYMSSLCRH
jgi:hypothetical protein